MLYDTKNTTLAGILLMKYHVSMALWKFPNGSTVQFLDFRPNIRLEHAVRYLIPVIRIAFSNSLEDKNQKPEDIESYIHSRAIKCTPKATGADSIYTPASLALGICNLFAGCHITQPKEMNEAIQTLYGVDL